MLKIPLQTWSVAVLAFGFAHPAFALSGEQVYKLTASSIVLVRTSTGLGSGVLVGTDLIATNCHVVGSQDNVDIEYFGAIVAGSVVGRNDQNDVCAVRLQQKLKGAIPIRGVRRWETVKVGESVYTLGAPNGFKYTFTNGIVSQKRKHKGGGLVQFDAAISHGNSGGGLFDSDARLIGLPSFMMVDAEHAQNLNFAWSVNAFPEPLRSAIGVQSSAGGGTDIEQAAPNSSLTSRASPSQETNAHAWRTAYSAGRVSESLTIAQNWIKDDPHRADAWVAHGLSLDAMNPGSGFDSFKNALKCNHSYQPAMYHGAISARASGRDHDYRQLLGTLRKANSALAKQLEQADR